MEHQFYAMVSRMKYIERWALMRNSREENISEHSQEVSILSHALAVISNERLGNDLHVERAALLGLYHDTTEIITGDMPTPIKYYNSQIQGAFKEVEKEAANRLLNMLPEDIRKNYLSIFHPVEEDRYLWRLVKAADRLSALIKCIEESKVGNKEFISAERTIRQSLVDMGMREIEIFMDEFLPSYYQTLDELQQ